MKLQELNLLRRKEFKICFALVNYNNMLCYVMLFVYSLFLTTVFLP